MQTNSNVGHLHKISLFKDTGILINILAQWDCTHLGSKTSPSHKEERRNKNIQAIVTEHINNLPRFTGGHIFQKLRSEGM